MISMMCGSCGKSVEVDERSGQGQLCPRCGASLSTAPVSTALSDLLEDGAPPVRFGAYSKAAEETWEDPAEQSTAAASWDDPFEPRVEEQVQRLVEHEKAIDSAVAGEIPPEVRARFRARQREVRNRLVKLGLALAAAVGGLALFILY